MDIESENWHVMTRSRGGTVSLIKNVSLRVASEIVRNVTPRWPVLPPGNQNSMVILGRPSDGEIVQTEILGPPGWDGCPAAFTHDWRPQDVNGQTFGNVECEHCKAVRAVDADGNPVKPLRFVAQ